MDRTGDFLAALPAGLLANRSSAEAALLIADRIAALQTDNAPRITGLNGAQGSGKSTLARLVGVALQQFHSIRPALLSLDDFYLSKAARLELARDVHPLCATRGVPGTHDVPLMAKVFDALAAAGAGDSTRIPVFDKLADDRLPEADWCRFDGRPGAILFEGWCVGLRAEDVPPWKSPINRLEAEQDPQGKWFAWSLAALRRNYPAIWDRIGFLVSIEVPGIETVISSRLEQEDGLHSDSGHKRMDRAEVTRFVEHYERYTRALWAAMPKRANLLFRRDASFDYALVQN